MARSEPAIAETDEHHIEYTEADDQSRLVVRTDTVTVTIEGDPAEVRRQFEEYHAAALNLSANELADAIDAYPMPEPDDLDSIPADEFYDRD